MIRKLIAFVFLYSLVSIIASADSYLPWKRYYVKVLTGVPAYIYTDVHDFKNARLIPGASVAVGKEVSNSMAIEIEGAYRYISGDVAVTSTSYEKVSASAISAFVNAIWMMDYRRYKINPYIGVGAGASYSKTKSVYIKDSEVFSPMEGGSFAAQGFIGGDYEYSQNLSFLGEVRYIYLGRIGHRHTKWNKPDVTQTATVSDVYNASVMFGIRYKF